MKGNFTDGVFVGCLIVVGAVFALLLFARFLELISPLGDLPREVVGPWLAIGTPLLIASVFAFDRWTKTKD